MASELKNSVRLDFRIDWGYQYLYSRRHYHPTYLWDGTLSCDQGEILEIYQLEYPFLWFGIGHCAKETRLEEPRWESRTKRGFAGVRIVAEVAEQTEFVLSMLSGQFHFRAKDILEKGRIEFPVGPKYLGCYVTVTRTGFLWFRSEPRENSTVLEAGELGLPVHPWARMDLAWLKPDEEVSWEATIPTSAADVWETLFHIQFMAVPDYSEEEHVVMEHMPMELFCDGESLCRFQFLSRPHDTSFQILSDVWQRASVSPGRRIFALKNHHREYNLGINRIIMTQSERRHGQLSVPPWAMVGEKMIGKVFAAYKDDIAIETSVGKIVLPCQRGWNLFAVTAEKEGSMRQQTGSDQAETEVLLCQEEEYPIKVGYDMTQIPHDDTGFMDWLLDYTYRTRLGNYVLFRSFDSRVSGEDVVDEALLARWGEFCCSRSIYVGAVNNYASGTLAHSAGAYFNDCGKHEFSGVVYACDPAKPYASEDMKQAAERYIAYLQEEVQQIHQVSHTAAFGDPSGGARYAYLAGADMIRAETMVPHTMTLLSQVRPAAQALGKGRWGVHIAIQHCYYPYRENHLGQYFLCLMQPWMMGAELIYEEDSLFGMWSEERQCWDDALVKGKRDMTRNFYKFAKTHPRQGRCVRNIAFVEGRYAAPFNGFICDKEQDPHYSVWGRYGKDAPEWGHGQPEKCRQILDVLMPGASTHPLRQRYDKRRFYFSGTPYGDFDCVPIEASSEYLRSYRLLLNLGWNTMIQEDYDKICDYVAGGGVLLTGIPQFSTDIKRDFLSDMKQMKLWKDGDLTELCGIVVRGSGQTYSGQWNCAGRENLDEPELSAMPSDDVGEDGVAILADVCLCGAEIVAWDSASGMPMLVRKAKGKGWVYTFTLWAYPGHEKFQRFAAVWVSTLAKEALPEIHVEDSTGEIFWTCWEKNGENTVMLLNTDWTRKENEIETILVVGEEHYTITVRERMAVMAHVSSGSVRMDTVSLDSAAK